MEWLRKFMVGRYGSDQLSTGLLILWIIISILSRFINSRIIEILNIIIPMITLYRMFSKNISKRYEENMRFLKLWNPIKSKANSITRKVKGLKHYRYYKCISCKQTLRVPKGKGRISVTCPKCKTIMIKKS